jgi:hypothetical protein
MSDFRCPECGYSELSNRRVARCPGCGRPNRSAAQSDSSGLQILIWLGVGAMVLILLAVVGVGVAGYLAFRAGKSAMGSAVTAMTPPATPAEALADLQAPSGFRTQLTLNYLKTAPVDPALQPQIAAELERYVTANDFNAWAAADALVTWATVKQVPTLIVAAQGQNIPVRNSAYKALARLRDPRALPVFAKGLEDMQTRHEAAEALIEIGPAAETDVVPYASHRDVFVRMEANRVLKEIGTAKSLPALRAAYARYLNSDRSAALMLNDVIQTIQNRPR